MTAFVARWDMRFPGATPEQRSGQYRRAIEQAAYIDAHGFAAIMLSEHHGSDDGYLPSPLVMASAVAAVTSQTPITVSALVANLYEPTRLAEDIAVLDHLSGGRVSYTIGLGYRAEEYAMFDREWSTRGKDIEQQILDLLAAWRGEPVNGSPVTPAPFSQPHPVLFYGGQSPAAARRAARLGLHFQPQAADRELKRIYEETCRELGNEPGMTLMPPSGPAYVFCTEDPDRFWAEHGSHLLADAQAYSSWQGKGAHSFVADDSESVAELREAGTYAVCTPDELIDRVRAREIKLISTHPGCAGLPDEPSWETLHLLVEKVRPALLGP